MTDFSELTERLKKDGSALSMEAAHAIERLMLDLEYSEAANERLENEAQLRLKEGK